jgi:hypothetical protein
MRSVSQTGRNPRFWRQFYPKPTHSNGAGQVALIDPRPDPLGLVWLGSEPGAAPSRFCGPLRLLWRIVLRRASRKPCKTKAVAVTPGRGRWLSGIVKPLAMDEGPSGSCKQVTATFLTPRSSAFTDSDRVIRIRSTPSGQKRWRVANPCWRRVLYRRSTRGPTAREASSSRAPSQIKVCYRDIALHARFVGSGLGSCVLIKLTGLR